MALKDTSLLESHLCYAALLPNLLHLIFSPPLLHIAHLSPNTLSLPGLFRLKSMLMRSPQGALIMSKLVTGECPRHTHSWVWWQKMSCNLAHLIRILTWDTGVSQMCHLASHSLTVRTSVRRRHDVVPTFF